jgi:hypothetical protein
MRIRIQLITLMRSGYGFESGFLFDADADPDADPYYQNDADSCGSGPTTLLAVKVAGSIHDRERKDVSLFHARWMRFIEIMLTFNAGGDTVPGTH